MNSDVSLDALQLIKLLAACQAQMVKVHASCRLIEDFISLPELL